MAVIVICVGLLGIAKMQALSMSNTTTSRQRALAAIQASSLASAMHSNRQYWANGALPANFSATLAGGVLASNEPTLTAALAATNAGACMATQCTAVALAAFDLTRWSAALAALLPNPSSTIGCSFSAGIASPMSCTIQISWTERAVAVNQQEAQVAGNPQIQRPDYTLYVEP